MLLSLMGGAAHAHWIGMADLSLAGHWQKLVADTCLTAVLRPPALHKLNAYTRGGLLSRRLASAKTRPLDCLRHPHDQPCHLTS